MATDDHDERELRAARNQSLFRAVNEKIRGINEAFSTSTEPFVIACECADTNCVQTLTIPGDEYATIRTHPRRFAVLTGHVYPDVEYVVTETETYVVVEKVAKAGEAAELLEDALD